MYVLHVEKVEIDRHRFYEFHCTVEFLLFFTFNAITYTNTRRYISLASMQGSDGERNSFPLSPWHDICGYSVQGIRLEYTLFLRLLWLKLLFIASGEKRLTVSRGRFG